MTYYLFVCLLKLFVHVFLKLKESGSNDLLDMDIKRRKSFFMTVKPSVDSKLLDILVMFC